MNKYDLDIPIYLNQKIVFDLLASINDGFSELSKLKTTNGFNGEIDGSVDAGLGNKNIFAFLGAKISGKVNNQQTSEEEIEKIHTPSSLFNNLKSRLFKEKMIVKIDSEKQFNNLKTGDFIEISGTLSQNPLISVMDKMTSIMELTSIFSKDGTGRKAKENNLNNKNIISQMNGFSESLKGNGMVDLICDVNINSYSFKCVLPVNMDYFFNRNANEIIDGNFKILGKVTKKCIGDDKINLLRNTSLTLMKESTLVNLLTSFNMDDNEDIDFGDVQAFISAPALLIIPIAIYI